jgi:hypothetical protein
MIKKSQGGLPVIFDVAGEKITTAFGSWDHKYYTPWLV